MKLPVLFVKTLKPDRLDMQNAIKPVRLKKKALVSDKKQAL